MKTDDLRRKMEIDVAEGTTDLDFECYMTEPAEMADLEYILEIDEFAQDNPARRRMIEKSLIDNRCWIVTDQAQVIAYAIFDYSYQKNQGFVHLVYVARDYRRQQVALDLLESLEGTCETPKIYTEIPVDNLAAQELFICAGYRVTKPPKRDYSRKDEGILFVKNIWEPPPPIRRETVQ